MTDSITGRTKICALIGDPVEHSVSPAMHNAAFQKLGLDYFYVPFRVAPEQLKQAVAGFRALNLRGFNVTIPHKVAVIPLLDKLDPLAQKIGAVNTVVNDNGKLTGFNTDTEGFLRALVEKGFKPKNKKVVVLGAGGASRAICYILAQQGALLTILNRRQELDWALDIARFITKNFKQKVAALELSHLADILPADLLINATSVGMSPNAKACPVPTRLLKGVPLVFDIVYNPIKTKLIKDAAVAGAMTIGGVDMLAWQGALAFEKWTGQKAPLDLMRRTAVKILERHED
ncbi:MAG: shikimate dehydrogenase [Dehalococcoidales bacterium]|nr:shikimate dehydrogenase [Dehalococcoidales bacterium]